MCGRYTLVLMDNLREAFGAEEAPAELRPNYNVAPGQLMPVVTRNSPNRIELMRWGLVPSWAKDPKIGYKMINARAEGIQDKPSFRAAVRRRRCLVPSTGFYEWKKEGAGKVPYFIRLRDRETFAFAGLWEEWKDAEGVPLRTYTIITTAPNSLMEGMHDRMPVILAKEDEAEWLDPDLQDPEQVTRLLGTYPAGEMETYAVSAGVNSVRNNDPSLVVPADPVPVQSGGPDSL